MNQTASLVKRLFGSSENPVKTQNWIAITVDVLIATVKMRINTESLLYTILQILSLIFSRKHHLINYLKTWRGK
ncbi:hypothetical protein ACTRXD_17930 [Nitrospira sp. T9]|uniref:hypothetical protein n=1 Tax=unclassified Nitrospira TaxID=2652172 RepID=UPI003F9C2642